MTDHEFTLAPRPVVVVRDRSFVLLDELRPALGIQLLPVADLTSLVGPSDQLRVGLCVDVWYDGSGVCYARHGASAPHRLPVVDLPLWIEVDVRSGLSHLMMPA